MKPFMDEEFLLDTDAARRLYHTYAEPMPIADYHCHIDAREIFEDRRFENLTQAWLGGDHYKWRLMRAGGVPGGTGHRKRRRLGKIPEMGQGPGTGGGQSAVPLEPSGAEAVFRVRRSPQ